MRANGDEKNSTDSIDSILLIESLPDLSFFFFYVVKQDNMLRDRDSEF